LIKDAIKAGDITGEITFRQIKNEIQYEEKRYANGTINPTDIDIKDPGISLLIDNKNCSGRTVIIKISDEEFFDLKNEFVLEFDGVKIQKTDNLYEVLNSTNNFEAEYFVMQGEDGIEILVTIPSFAEHTITIYQVVETISIVLVVVIYASICILGATAFISPIFTGTIRFRKRK